jgi:UPF0271 protein
LPNLDSKEFVLDANAFYAGFPFLSYLRCYTTNLVFSEVKHIKRSYSALEALIDAGNLKVMDPKEQFLKKVIAVAKTTGDALKLSSSDLSILALAFQLKITLISDDYAVENIGTILKIPIKSIGTKGITEVRKWISFCNECGKAYNPNLSECMICGNKLSRRFKKHNQN